MASTDNPMLLPPDVEKAAPSPPPLTGPPPPLDYFRVVDVVLRLLLFLAALVAVVVMVTSKETKAVATIPIAPFVVYKTADFKDSPALVYFVVALSVAGYHAIITTRLSYLALLKRRFLPRLLRYDVLELGIVASAAGTAGGVAYIGIRGNSHTGWTKLCNVYSKFCAHVEASIAVSIFASILLALLVILAHHSLSKKIPNPKEMFGLKNHSTEDHSKKDCVMRILRRIRHFI